MPTTQSDLLTAVLHAMLDRAATATADPDTGMLDDAAQSDIGKLAGWARRPQALWKVLHAKSKAGGTTEKRATAKENKRLGGSLPESLRRHFRETGFSGEVKDDAGHRHCFSGGKPTACGGGDEPGGQPVSAVPKPAGEPPGQKRAKSGGELGPNGEWYQGGAYIATTALSKMHRQKLQKGATGKEQVEPRKWEVPPAGKLPILQKLGLGVALNAQTMELNKEYLANYEKQTPEQIEQLQGMLDAYKRGERYVDANDHPDLMHFGDAARMTLAGMPVPGAALARIAKGRKMTVEELEKQLGVTKYDGGKAGVSAEMDAGTKGGAAGGTGTSASPSAAPSTPAPTDPPTPTHAALMARLASNLESTPHLTPAARTAYHAAAQRVVHAMTEKAAKHVADDLVSVSWHADTQSLTDAYTSRIGTTLAPGKQVGGFYSHADGHLAVDGMTEKTGAPGMGVAQTNIHGAYAHEIGHIVDRNYRYSSTKEWRAAWQEEIVGSIMEGPKLSYYARKTGPHEGWAEMARAIWGSDVPREVTEKRFPKCVAFFRKHGLV